MTLIERCWIWERRSQIDGAIHRGVMFHEPETSVPMLDGRIEEFVPAEQLAGAVSTLDALVAASRAFLDPPGHPALTRARELIAATGSSKP